MRVSAKHFSPLRLHVARTGSSRATNLLCSSFRTAKCTRNASTTSASQPQESRHSIENLWNAKDLASIRESCSALAHVKGKGVQLAETPSPSDKERIHQVITQLAKSGHPEDLKCIEDVLQTVYPVLGLEVGQEEYVFIVQQLQAYDHDREALKLLTSFSTREGLPVPTISTFQTFFEACTRRQPLAFIQDSIDTFKQVNPEPSTGIFLSLFETRFSTAELEDSFPNTSEIESLLRWCVDRGMAFDPIISSKVHHAFADRGDLEGAKQLLAVYEMITRPALEVNDALESLSTVSDEFGATKTTQMLSATYEEFIKDSQATGFKPNPQHYQVVIKNCLNSGNYKGAFAIYEKSREENVLPTKNVVEPLIQALHSGDYLAFSEEAVDKALELYKHLDEASTVRPGEAPSPAICASLIRMVISAPDAAKYQDDLEMLIFDMERRGYTTNKSFLAATKIIAEMRRVGSFAKILDYYRDLRTQLDERGYLQVLQEYCRISFAGDLQVPLITDYFSIIQHMRFQNVKVTPNAYTIILHQIGIVATKLRQSSNPHDVPHDGVYKRLVDTTRRIHQYLSLDAAIAPNAILWNQLMNTYQRLLLWRDVENLWRTMQLSGRFNQRTINILIDSAGYSGNMRFIKAVISKLLKSGHKLDAQNWDTLVEALCRNSLFGEALEIICVELPKYRLTATAETVRIFAKFARKRDVWLLYRPSLEAALPELWQSLPDSIKHS